MYKTSIKNIKRWNGLRDDIIRIGQKLEIYTKNSKVKNYSTTTNNNVSKKILRIILSYTDYINRTIWSKEK